MKVAEIVVKILESEGITDALVYPGLVLIPFISTSGLQKRSSITPLDTKKLQYMRQMDISAPAAEWLWQSVHPDPKR